jgi:aromatic-L-amino-acid decarboxylase
LTYEHHWRTRARLTVTTSRLALYRPPYVGETRRMRPLYLPPDEFAALAERVVGTATDFLATLDDRRTSPATSAADTTAAFDQPLPERGIGGAVLEDLHTLAAHARASTGRLFPYVVGSGESIGALGDLYASVLNQNVTAWRSAPAAVTVERTVVRWLAEAIGCAGSWGSLTSGGSLANLMALAMARESRAPANDDGATPCVVYASTEVHMAIPKAVALLGIGRANLRLIPVDADFRIDVKALEAAIADDQREDLRGIAVVATAGTITTGAIDPLPQLAELARANDLWLHVDGAYGAAAAIAEPGKFAGLSVADSVVLDAHKWLYQPIDCSVLLYRDAELAQKTFAYTGDYARTLTDDPIEGYAFFEESIELSRRFRALKLWLSLRYHGLAAFRAAIAENLRQARLLAQLIEEEPSLELLAPVELSAVCFRWTGAPEETLDRANANILRHITKRGRVALSNANVRGTFSLRACIVNHLTNDDDIAAVIEEVLTAAAATTR